MAQRDEQVSRIEAALKARFFGYVPKVDKPDRAKWLEDQHTVDRLSRALAAYALVAECGIDDASAVGFITDGGKDGGIDAMSFHRSSNRLIFVQAKFKRTGSSPAQGEVQKTIEGVRNLRGRRFDGFNEAIKLRLDEIEEALAVPTVRIHLLVVYLGDAFNVDATQDLNNYANEINRYGSRFEWRACGLSTVHGWLQAEQEPRIVDAQVTLENWCGVLVPRRAFYGQIAAADLAKLVEREEKTLFQRNIRHYLGSLGVNTAIERTVRSRPADFFYLNNGITATARSVVLGLGDERKCVFELKDLSIVNGAQTAGAIAGASLAGPLSSDAKLLITIIEVDGTHDNFGLSITRARNHQNVVRSVDFAALDPTQERLRQDLAMAGVTYHYRPSAEALVRRDDAFTIQEAAIAIACLAFTPLSADEARRRGSVNGVDFIVTAKKEVSRLWDQDGGLYAQLFPTTITGVKMYRLVLIHRFIDEILAASERAEPKYDRKMFFRHARYFIMAFVAMQTKEVVERSSLELTNSDRTALSRQINELAELIYKATRASETYKGQLAIFRNLGDAQPVADRVLDALRPPLHSISAVRPGA